MDKYKIVSREQWLDARKEFLAKEKEFTRHRDKLSEERRNLPWVKVDKDYVFDGPNGARTLSDLFANSSQLVVYHFMFGPNWEEGCKTCSFWADGYNSVLTHLAHRDVSLVAISKAPIAKLQTYKKRMDWSFEWVSALNNNFNEDYHVTFTPAQIERGETYYNYRENGFPGEEAPGVSVFIRDNDGSIYHTYSCYSRGLDILNPTYHYLDLVPKGRDEDDTNPTSWLKRHDEYESAT